MVTVLDKQVASCNNVNRCILHLFTQERNLTNLEARQLMLRTARLYYVDNLTQDKIAKEIRASRPTVSRLLQQARQEGIVEIRIIDPDATLASLEAQLVATFGLVEARVVSVETDAIDVARRRVGQAAARYLERTLQNGNVVGIGWGRTMHEVVGALDPRRKARISVVPLIGGLGQIAPMFQVHELARALGSAFGGTWQSLYVPALVESADMEASLRRTPDMQETMALWNKLDVAIVGIGNVDFEVEMQMLFVNYLSAQTQESLRLSRAVGDICVRFFDIDGTLCADALTGVLGIELHQLRRARRVVGVAAGAAKSEAILGAVRGKHVNTLIVDEAAAKRMLSLHEGRAS